MGTRHKERHVMLSGRFDVKTQQNATTKRD